MKKLLYLLLLTPIIYLTSCSSAKNELTPTQQEESDFIGIWERSALGYNGTESYWYEDEYMDGVLEFPAHWEDYGTNPFYLTGSAMESYYNYDRYVIELHLDSTYDEYMYNNNVALHYTGNWVVDLVSETITLNGNIYTYTKNNENTYEINLPGEIEQSIEPPNWANSDVGIFIMTDMYERYVRIDSN